MDSVVTLLGRGERAAKSENGGGDEAGEHGLADDLPTLAGGSLARPGHRLGGVEPEASNLEDSVLEPVGRFHPPASSAGRHRTFTP
jgi:hypothetical protein